MKKILIFFILVMPLCLSQSARADLFSGDVAVLTQILANAVQQLSQLQSIVGNGEQDIDLIRGINRGINDSLNLLSTVGPVRDAGLKPL